jgi:hypothetical protein
MAALETAMVSGVDLFAAMKVDGTAIAVGVWILTGLQAQVGAI